MDEAPLAPVQAPRRWRWLRRLLWLPVAFVAATVAQVAVLRFVDPPTSAFMLARQAEAWSQGEWRFRVAYDWRDLDTISPHLPLAVIAAEDQRFASHWGFDLDAIEQAIDHNARGKRIRGGSTISQQVAKNLFLWQGRSWLRKGLEAWYTLLIEAMWPKRRILEVHVNVAEFGDGIYGAQAAARSYWRKDAARLTMDESARLAAVLPAPRRYSASRPGPYVQRRAAWIQRQMRQIGGPDHLRRLD
ncbi:monofunctional biosynthetic peptidoglycan transglycosylase [Pseudoxanthomonas broegbernensis]|uniref:Biosynthetic peptidoglycan transglycosylase n=1 Tax=Pseudoxanthomonas broegbernensis TaxID=83619 RepID=A0A7V8K6F8_9GAMM|nr:monofunctional biosynthetic peptidoglycan transglycosylase [Pseudoxanthomonas broegbernensis]KAF1685035.1 monofunctional biosynthetic peptidoglycan transglycosylase [Pseudoxanthomonas broegbernensis]MBB6066375.1 monofunctional biosynthetic peptidoglycan transglycosylase [Pseudoxanthomonas broegbernensis]